MDNTQKKNTAAKIRANNKYNAKTYKSFTVNAKIHEYEIINRYCNNYNISKTQLLIKSTLYCIDNNIDLSAYQPKDKDK